MVNFSSFYTSLGGPKIPVLSFCLDFTVYPWIKALHVSFLFLFLFCFLGNSSLKVFQLFPFHRRCFSQTIQASAEVNENRFLLRARRETLWRFSCLDEWLHALGPFFPESRKLAGHLSFFTIFLLAEVPWTFLSWISWFSPSDSKVLWDHSSISSFPTKGTWPFVVVSSVNPLGLPPFFARLSYGYHSSTLFLGPLSWVIFTLSKVYSFLLLLLGFCLFFTVL